jgi:hypothetical protein
MLRKAIALAVAAGVMVACLPGTAAASWSHKGEAIQENLTYTIGALGLTGNVRFQGGLGGIECQVTAGVLLEPGTTGTLNTFRLDPVESEASTSRCKGLGGLTPCQIHQFEPTGLSWTLHTASATTISVTAGDLHTSLTGGIFCLAKQVRVTASTLTWTVNNPNAIGKVTVSGSPQADIQTNSGTVHQEQVTASGELNVESPSATTYGI